MALLAWGAAWLVMMFGGQHGWPITLTVVIALAIPAFAAVVVNGRMRQALLVLGFPASAVAWDGASALPGWAWLLALAFLAWVYPLRAWRDAPLFPTPRAALIGLCGRLPLPRNPRMLDAGCGVGDGLLALRTTWPHASVEGVEWSAPLAWLTRLRVRGATVRRGDMWRDDWSRFDLVYVFQRPESMPHVWAKAQREMREGAWLVSLEFTIPHHRPTLSIAIDAKRSVHAWCIVHGTRAQSTL